MMPLLTPPYTFKNKESNVRMENYMNSSLAVLTNNAAAVCGSGGGGGGGNPTDSDAMGMPPN